MLKGVNNSRQQNPRPLQNCSMPGPLTSRVHLGPSRHACSIFTLRYTALECASRWFAMVTRITPTDPKLTNRANRLKHDLARFPTIWHDMIQRCREPGVSCLVLSSVPHLRSQADLTPGALAKLSKINGSKRAQLAIPKQRKRKLSSTKYVS